MEVFIMLYVKSVSEDKKTFVVCNSETNELTTFNREDYKNDNWQQIKGVFFDGEEIYPEVLPYDDINVFTEDDKALLFNLARKFALKFTNRPLLLGITDCGSNDCMFQNNTESLELSTYFRVKSDWVSEAKTPNDCILGGVITIGLERDFEGFQVSLSIDAEIPSWVCNTVHSYFNFMFEEKFCCADLAQVSDRLYAIVDAMSNKSILDASSECTNIDIPYYSTPFKSVIDKASSGFLEIR